MANIVQMKDSANAVFYPQTHEKAVIDSNGVNLQTKLASITTPTYVTAWDGDSTPVVANIPAGVSVTYNTTTYTGTLAASASTANKTYLVSTGTTDNYNRYVTQLNGSTYSWQNLGSTEIDLSDYATKEELGQLDQKEDELDAQLNGLPELNFQKSDYQIQPGLITSEGIFRSNSVYGTANSHILIPMSAHIGRTVQFTTIPAHHTNDIAFLTSDALVSGSDAPFCSGQTVISTSGQYIVPNDCAYMYVYAERQGADSFPALSLLAVGGLGPDDIGAVAVAQGSENAGKVLAVGVDGNVTPTILDPGEVTGAVRKVLTKTIYLASDIAALGTLGAGWSGTVADGFTHASGNTADLVLNTTDEGKVYLVTITSSSNAENLYTVKIGDGPALDPYNGTTTQYVGIVSDGGAVKITPASSFAGSISVKVQEIVSEAEAVENVTLTVLNVDADDMVAAQTAFWNVAVGPDSNTLGSAVSASRNIAIGLNALRKLETGTRNIAVGTFTAPALKDGFGNIAIGADSLFLRQGGNDNIAIGRSAIGGAGNAVESNVCIGTSAGSIASGNNNVCIGPFAGYRATEDSVYIGKNAGYDATGLKNIFIGINSGYMGAQRSGNWNTIIGPSTAIANGVSKSTAIGYLAKAEKSNQCVIGSSDCVEVLLHGDVIVRGTDSVFRKLKFNQDGTVTWEAVE